MRRVDFTDIPQNWSATSFEQTLQVARC